MFYWLLSEETQGNVSLKFNCLLISNLSYLKIQVLDMMEENEAADDIAKLEQQEFGLDLEELERLHNENEQEVEKVTKTFI